MPYISQFSGGKVLKQKKQKNGLSLERLDI